MEPQGLYVYYKAFDSTLIKSFLEQQQFYPITANGRSVIQYGRAYKYRHGDKEIPVGPVPDIIDQLMKQTLNISYDSIIVNRYIGDQGISEHTDSLDFDDIIICFIVGGGAEIEFNRKDQRYCIYLADGDIYAMTGESRYSWTHQIRKRKYDHHNGEAIARTTRYSITYRSVKK